MKNAIFAAALLAFSLPAMAQKVEGCSTKAWKTSNKALAFDQSRAMVTPSYASSPHSKAARLRIGGVPASMRSMPRAGR